FMETQTPTRKTPTRGAQSDGKSCQNNEKDPKGGSRHQRCGRRHYSGHRLGARSGKRSAKPLPMGRGDSGRYEAVSRVKQRFGDETSIRATWMDKSGLKDEKGVMGFGVLVWTDLCQDYFTMGFDSHGFPECFSPSTGNGCPCCTWWVLWGIANAYCPEW